MRSVREVVADSLAASEVTTVFALMGAANQELMCDLSERHGIRLVHGRHESGTVGMADGYSRFSGTLGVATVTSGPGVTNTATALAVARAHATPVLLLAGDSPRGDVRNPQYLDQQSFTGLCGGASGYVGDPIEMPRLLGDAGRALASDAPYTLNMPLDVQELTTEADAVELRSIRGRATGLAGDPGHAQDNDLVHDVAQLLLTATRPVILAGRGALRAERPVSALADLLGAPVVTTLRAAGFLADHALQAGVCGPMGDGRSHKVLAEADVVLALGSSLHPLATWALSVRSPYPALVRVDTAEPPGDLPCGTYLRGDVEPVAEALLGHLSDLLPSGRPRPVLPARIDTFWDRSVSSGVHVHDALDTLRTHLPEQRLMVIGGGHAALSACQAIPPTGRRDFTCVSTDFGAIGQALPVAIGACFARPGERVHHVTADGELMMSLAELHTAVRYHLPLTVIVLNDHGFGQERHNLTRAGRPRDHAAHPTPDLAALAEAMGATGYRVTRSDELPTLKRVLSHRPDDGVVLVDVRIDPAYLNPASAHVAAAMAAGAHRP
ncbi:thiamine pyrophosphate-binding protein [Streptomyces sp. SID6648]|nr:thiamine pyrophosphate-binding protein [Streptomyces sp. SID6648]